MARLTIPNTMKTKLELLGSRSLLAVGLRRSGMTFRKIGERIGVGPQRASQIVARGERMLERWEQGDDAVELNCRTSNCISNAGVGFSREAVKEAIESGVLHPKKSGTMTMTETKGLNEPELLEWDDGSSFRPRAPDAYRLRNYGWKTHKLCCEYAGIPYHREEERLKRLRAEVARLEEKIKGIEKGSP